jgi:sterol 3beta-glucosyltransferase
MKIIIPTIGSRGDVQPFIALAQGLVQAGHSVTLASHPVMGPLVESHGVAFAPIGPDIDLAREVAPLRGGGAPRPRSQSGDRLDKRDAFRL